jgi:hypothetical protein
LEIIFVIATYPRLEESVSLGTEKSKGMNISRNENLATMIWRLVVLCTCLRVHHGFMFTGTRDQFRIPSALCAEISQLVACDLVRSLVVDEQCFTTPQGARAFGDVCAPNAIYEDRFEPQPIVGKSAITRHLMDRALARQQRPLSGFRLDKISDGTRACGFTWTWTFNQEEGLRGTTFVELNDNNQIQYVQEIPEPLFKPGEGTKALLKAVTADAEWKPPQSYVSRTPTKANELAKYLYVDLQNAGPQEGLDEFVRFLSDNIVYRDFNYENVLRGPKDVRQFVEGFRFPGIEFRPLRFDDGVDSTCFTWEVVLNDAPDTIKGISFYELDPVTRLITYIRDVPESAIKPPILGNLARRTRPGLGVFWGVPLGSRPDGL